MITLFNLWQILIGEVNTPQGGHVKPNRNFTQWANTISKEIFNDLTDEYEKSRVVSDMLTPFLKYKNVVITPAAGQMWDIVVKPDDYNYFASAKVIRRQGKSCGCSLYETIDGRDGKITDKSACSSYIDQDELELLQQQAEASLTEVEITKVRSAQWAGVCKHVTMGPTWEAPKCTLFDKGLKIAPKGLGVIVLEYFRKPVEATFNYTILNPGQENEYIQYDPNSQPLEWDDKMIPEFIARLKKKYGVFVRENIISQAGAADAKL